MLVTLTGPSCSGRSTLARFILREADGARRVRVYSTCQSNLFCEHISASELERMSRTKAIALHTQCCGESVGISDATLDGIASSSRISVAVLNFSTALAMGRAMRERGHPSVCYYLHCGRQELLERAAERVRRDAYGPESQHSWMHDIYSDHSARFSRLERDSLSGMGYDAVFHLNTERVPETSYALTVLKPIQAMRDLKTKKTATV